MLAELIVRTPIGVFKMFFSCRIRANIGNAVMANAVPTKTENEKKEIPCTAKISKYQSAAMLPKIKGNINATTESKNDFFITFLVNKLKSISAPTKNI